METRRIGTIERVARCLARIASNDPQLRAMITTTSEAARAQAEACDRAMEAGRPLGLLHGVPVTLKDVIFTAGVRTTCGSRFFTDFVPDEDAEVVRRLRAAGAVIIGKVNLHEFAYGGTTQNPFYGSCRNPWDLDRIPGGSSGGSAAAAAAGFCTVSLGTDTSGSGRVPAALNGLATLRPTPGRISNYNVFPLSPPYDTISPMAYRVEDVARVFSVLAGYDSRDPISTDRPLESFLAQLVDGIAGVRVGLPRNYFFEETDPEILRGVQAAASELERLGARLVEVEIPDAEAAKDQFEAIFHVDAAEIHRERIAGAPDRFGADTLERLEQMGLARHGIDYAASLRWQEAFIRRLEGTFAKVDMILSPGTGIVAPLVGESAQTTTVTRGLARFSYIWSIARVPVLSAPCGFTAAGLPFGFALAGRWWEEPLLLRVGFAYQTATDWHERRPPLAASD